jgi:hypothetical protein
MITEQIASAEKEAKRIINLFSHSGNNLKNAKTSSIIFINELISEYKSIETIENTDLQYSIDFYNYILNIIHNF